uniref:Phage gp6-like head-tail connector protein n=1 Tax=Thermocrispum agreste TaxID=37925 RepID=A0A2W4JQF5_9PSEU|nr:MAG: hypothetical protein DIU77_03405 [Thermocrispum agreste]
MIDVGDVYRVAVDVRDADGTLANPATAELTITLPDGTTVNPPVPLPPAETGRLVVDYPTSQAGRHVYRLVTTGPVTAHADVFDVADADTGGLVSLADAKQHLNIPAARTADDEELRGFIAAATAVVERHVGAVVRREHVETFDGGRSALILSHAPVLSVTQVVEAGAAVDPSGYVLDAAAGVLVRTAGCWAAGPHAVQVTYVAGRTAVPAAYSRAALIIIGHMWETQRNTSAGRPPLGDTDLAATVPGSTYSVPRRALELLGDPVPGVA